jgi:Transglycosylase SLT domain
METRKPTSTARAVAIALALVAVGVLVVAVSDARGADRVDRLTQPALERAATEAAATGGIRSTRYADATPWMRRLSRELVARAFAGDARRWALCVVERESGFNPGAVSSTDDHGLPQVNRPSHRWVDYRRIVVDPVYAVAVMVRLSDRGRNRGPWGWSC